MFCDSCGTQVQPGQAVCSKCAKPLMGYVQQTNRLEHHVHLLGIFWIVYSVLHGIAGVVLMILANTLFGPVGRSDIGAPAFLQPLLSVVGILLIIKGIVGVAAGYGLTQRAPWARITIVVLGFLALLNVPFGTALGIYTIWVLLSPGADTQYQTLGRSVSA
jgi:predicted nucleic acid-binding Zn ribbon protein